MFVHEIIAEEVAATGTNTMFGLLGDANLFMANSFVEKHGGRYISAVHEASAVMMAFGYACRTGRLGVATVTQGPGLSNTSTALIEAVRSGTPVLLITGDTAPSNTINQQTLDQEPFVRATGAGYVLVTGPQDAAAAVRRAAAQAIAQSRPVVLNCPTEYQWAPVDADAADADAGDADAGDADAGDAGPPGRRVEPGQDPWSGDVVGELSDDAIGEAVAVIAAARRPLVLAGRGVTDKQQREAVLAFAERIGAPIVTTLRARNLYSAAEGCLGVCGTVSTEVGVQAITESDTIIAFGASLNTWTTVRNSLLAGKRLVYVDLDQARFRPDVPVTAGVVGDAATVAGVLIEWLDAAEVPASGFRARATAGVGQSDLMWDAPLGATVTLAGVLSAVSRALPGQRTVVYDGGRFQGEAFKYLGSTDYRSEVQTTTFGAVGLGMGAAIGAAAAAPGEPLVFVTGDGGFMMNGLAELHSAIRANLPLIVVICNDRSYGAEYDQFVNKGVRADLSLFDWPDFADVARSLGAQGMTVVTVSDVAPAVAALGSLSRPVVIDLQIAPEDIPEVPH
jgi:acetolactate synthase I/II/III large subunit